MSTTLEWIVNNTTYNLGDASLMWREEDAGLGMAPLHQITERGPEQHGETFRGVRLDPRVFQMVFGISAASQSALWTLRDSILDVFAPAADETLGVMRWTRDDGSVRQLQCSYVGMLDFNSGDRRGFYQRVIAQFRAPNPTFYDPTQVTETCTLAAGMSIPLAVPVVIGSTVYSGAVNINYPGTWQALPVLVITGPITSPVVRNIQTDKKLDFTGTTIAAGDYYTIDCSYGVKSVTDRNGDYKAGNLVEPSNLSTFAIASKRDVLNGINTIQIAGTSTTSATQLSVAYYTRYIGI